MNKRKIIIIISCAFLFILGSFITIVIANNNNNDNKNLEKAKSNIKYLDNEITVIANTLNNISINSDESILNRNTDINWKNIEKSISNLYRNWNSIIIDFNNLNIKNTTLTDFGKKLDEIAVLVKNKDKNSTILKLSDLYQLLVQYTNCIDLSEELKNDINTKYYLLTAYSLMDTNNWSIINDNLIKAEQSYYKNINIVEENSLTHQYNREKIYVSIKELENTSKVKDRDLFYLKYKIVMENFS